jgi:hypothetical protein
MDFMKTALAGKDPGQFEPPDLSSTAVAQKVDTPDNAPAGEESH